MEGGVTRLRDICENFSGETRYEASYTENANLYTQVSPAKEGLKNKARNANLNSAESVDRCILQVAGSRPNT